MPKFESPGIVAALKFLGILGFASSALVIAAVLSDTSEGSKSAQLLFTLPGFGLGLLSFVLAKVIDCLALIVHNTTPRFPAA